MPSLKRLIPALWIAALAAIAALIVVPVAAASTTQESIMEDDVQLHDNMAGTLATMRALGVTRVKLGVYWDSIAPAAGSFHKPKNFDATDPAAYPATNWTFYDDVIREAQADGLQVGLMLTGPGPLWATGPGMPKTSNCPCGQWKPSPADFQAFVHAVGERYDGSYTPRGASSPLPRVSWWSIWNEPNYGPNLAPQATDHDTIEVGAVEYRGLLDAAWDGLTSTGHRPASDTILIGETAPRGLNHPIGNFSGDKPLRFLRALYCVNASYRPLRGLQATERDCPTSAAGTSTFRARNPALFGASGYAVHPYEQGVAPNIPTYACGPLVCWNAKTRKSDPDYTDFPEIPRLEKVLDRLNTLYGSHTRFPIWNTEYGYFTYPPDTDRGSLPAATVAYYINWAEYLSYIQPRIRSYDQYLLVDPPVPHFATGLELNDGTPTATYHAFQIPLYMPVTASRAGVKLTVWGGARPAPYALSDTGLNQEVQIQFQPGSHGRFGTLQTVAVSNPLGYFEVKQAFGASGSVRLEWTTPSGAPTYSRTVTVSIS